MSAGRLCYFNLKTRNPAEINPHLSNRVGCRKFIGANYVLSPADTRHDPPSGWRF
jgi:hypothetical protein